MPPKKKPLKPQPGIVAKLDALLTHLPEDEKPDWLRLQYASGIPARTTAHEVLRGDKLSASTVARILNGLPGATFEELFEVRM